MKPIENISAYSKVLKIVNQCSKFKIGKTGESLDGRRNQPDYCDSFPHIDNIFEGTEKDVSEMESYLIDSFMNNEKCMNRKDGQASVHDTMSNESGLFHVYVVWSN